MFKKRALFFSAAIVGSLMLPAAAAVSQPLIPRNVGSVTTYVEEESAQDSSEISSVSNPLEQFVREEALAAGRDPDEAWAKELRSMKFDNVLEQVTTDTDPGFISAEWNPQETDEAILYFCLPPNEHTQSVLAASEFNPTIMVNDGYCKKELEQAVSNAIDYVAARGSNDSVGQYDPVTGKVTITYSADEPLAIRARSSALSNDGQASAIEFVYRGAEPVTDQEYRGGDRFGKKRCTGGFVVRNGNTFGISTAAHCNFQGNNIHYSDGRFIRGGRLNVAYGDADWFWATSGQGYPSFRATTTEYQTVNKVGRVKVGLGFCQYGITSHTTCNRVYDVGLCSTSSGLGTVCGLAAATSHKTKGGDSGGPVFGQNIALGIHRGAAYVDGKDRSLFTPVLNLKDGANVSVYTK